MALPPNHSAAPKVDQNIEADSGFRFIRPSHSVLDLPQDASVVPWHFFYAVAARFFECRRAFRE